MARPLGNDTIYIQRATRTTDTVDNTKYDTFSAEIEVRNCSFQPFLPADKLQYEVTAEREFAKASWVVFAPQTADTIAIRPRDRVRVGSRTYEVFGEVGVWPSGRPNSHVQIILQTRSG